jgi:hypothetical protein
MSGARATRAITKGPVWKGAERPQKSISHAPRDEAHGSICMPTTSFRHSACRTGSAVKIERPE